MREGRSEMMLGQVRRLIHVVFIIITFLFAPFSVQPYPVYAAKVKPKYGPAGSPRALPLSQSHRFFQFRGHPAPDFWSLIGYYIPQFNGAACSAASVTMVLNAARAHLSQTVDDKRVTQTDLVEKVNVHHWKERLSAAGFEGEHGLSLELLGQVTEAAFKEYGFKKVLVKVVHVTDASPQTRRQMIRDLRQNEKTDRDFVIANFNQRFFTDDADVGHISPVAAFDEQNQKVLILDPDREYYEPYWVSVDTLLSGMATLDASAKSHRGYIIVRVH